MIDHPPFSCAACISFIQKVAIIVRIFTYPFEVQLSMRINLLCLINVNL